MGLEALTAGVPILVTSNSGLGILLGERNMDWAVVKCSNANDGELVQHWASAIARVLGNPQKYFGLAKEAREKLQGDRSWEEQSVTNLLQKTPSS